MGRSRCCLDGKRSEEVMQHPCAFVVHPDDLIGEHQSAQGRLITCTACLHHPRKSAVHDASFMHPASDLAEANKKGRGCAKVSARLSARVLQAGTLHPPCLPGRLHLCMLSMEPIQHPRSFWLCLQQHELVCAAPPVLEGRRCRG